VEGGGDEVMLVTGPPPQLPHDIRLVFQESTALAETLTACDTMEHGHGRLEARRLTASTALVDDRDGPGLAQVFPVERRGTVKKSGAPRAEGVDGVISLSPARARPAGLWRLVRPHWQIDNQGPWVRAVTFDEDRSHVRCGSLPPVMAAFRNTAIGLRHWAGETTIAAACRRVAAQPWLA
jgi:hypothetical protein